MIRRVGLGVVILVVLVVVLALVAVTGIVRQSFPQTAGTIQLNGLGADVTVVRDAQGAPQIYASSTDDLFRAQGFVAAQDRFFEMDFRRHVTAGRLSELVGKQGLDTDTVIRTLGWRDVAQQELPLLAPGTRQHLNAYADGVNDYIHRSGSDTGNMGLEYVVLGFQVKNYAVEDWSAVDSLAWLKAMAWDLHSNYKDELSRARLGTSFSADQLKIIYPDFAATGHDPILSGADWQPGGRPAASAVPPALSSTSVPTVTPAAALAAAPAVDPAVDPAVRPKPGSAEAVAEQAALANVQAALDAIPATVGRGEGIGSNSWVVAGSHTSTGKPLLANDPHLTASLPGIWYQTGLHCRTVSLSCPFDVSGFSFAGLPGIVIGHNNAIAWGFTNLGPDVSDFYLEKITDQTYLRDGKQVPLETRKETIKVAGEPDVPLTVRRTVHGPIVSDVIASTDQVGRKALVRLTPQQDVYAVSLSWTGIVPSTTADAIFALDAAQDFSQFRAAAAKFAVPAQNLIYADTAGHIGYQAPGLIPVRATSVPNTPAGYWPAPGWDSQYDWKGYVPFAQLPWTYDPPEGYIVTANQQVTAVRGGPFLTTDWDLGYRAQRIKDLLKATPKVSPDQMRQIQLDTQNGFAPALVKALAAINLGPDTETSAPADDFTVQGQRLLSDWDFTEPADKSKSGIRATYFNAVWVRLLQYTFDDELPTDLQADGGSRWMVAILALLKQPNNPWWDDKQTPGVVEGRDEILKKALVNARLDLTQHLGKDPVTWNWGALHEVTLTHQALGGDGVPGIVRGIFNRGPIGLPGGSSIVNANSYDAAARVPGSPRKIGTETFAVTSAPSMRMVVDLGNLDASTWVNQTGNSGHPYNAHYIDQADAWAAGETFPWPSTQAAVEASAQETLTLTPGERRGTQPGG